MCDFTRVSQLIKMEPIFIHKKLYLRYLDYFPCFNIKDHTGFCWFYIHYAWVSSLALWSTVWLWAKSQNVSGPCHHILYMMIVIVNTSSCWHKHQILVNTCKALTLEIHFHVKHFEECLAHSNCTCM